MPLQTARRLSADSERRKRVSMKSSPETVLCATDFSEHSASAFQYAAFLSSRYPAQLCLFHSIHFPQDQIHATDVFVKSQKMKRLKIGAEEQIQKFRLQANSDLSFEPLIHFGDPVESLVRVVENSNITLVVSGSRGLTAIQRVVMGSVIERLVRNLACPVLVVPKESAIPSAMKKIAVCSGLSASGNAVLETAVHLASVTGAQLHVIHVLGAPINDNIPEEMPLSYEKAQEKSELRLREHMVRRLTRLGARYESIVPIIRHGNAEEQIEPYLLENYIDLLVVGVRQRTRIGKLLIGATTEALLRHCRCPIMTVPVSSETNRLRLSDL